MSKVHIGKKIREVLKRERFPVAELARKINVTRDAAYKILDKETISSYQLQKISTVLKHDFFAYYQTNLSVVHEKPTAYGYATKEDVEVLTKLVHTLIKEVEKLREGQEESKKKVAKPRKK